MSWHQDEQLWKIFYDCMFDEQSFEQAADEAPQILAMLPGKVQKVLDLACGPGRHVLPFARLGLDVTGVDSSGFLLSRAADLVDQEQLKARLVHTDMLAYASDERYDLITNLFTSFGYYEKAEDNLGVLSNAHALLNDSGHLVIDTFGKENLLQHMQPVHLTEYDNGDIRIERPLLIKEMQVFSNEWLLISGDQVYRKSYQHYVYTATEMRDLLAQAGFSEINIYSDYEGSEYDMDSERMVAVAEK